jgi:hypothetical protein
MTTHRIKLSSFASPAAAVEAAILLSAQDAGATVVLRVDVNPRTLPEGAKQPWPELCDRLLSVSDQNAPEFGLWNDGVALRYHGHTSAGHPWEVVLL